MIPISRKRLFTTTVGVILAVAIIFTSYTVGNNMAKYQFYKSIEENPYQINLQVSGKIEDMLRAYNDIENLSHIKKTLFMSIFFGDYYPPEENLTNPETIQLNYLINFNITLLEGRMPKSYNEIAVEKNVLENYNWSIGDTISLTFWNTTTYTQFHINYTLVGIINVNMPTDWFRLPPGYVLVSLEGMKYLEKRVGERQSAIGYYFIAIDPEYLLQSTDVTEATNKIKNIKYQVINVVINHYLAYTDTGTEIMVSAGPFMLLFAIFYSLPVIVMGAYLSRVGIEIELFERRREFGILKIRGATPGALSKFILIEASIYGIIGGIIGYFLGEGLAYLSNFIFLNIPYFFLDIGMWELIGAIIFSLILFFIALASPWSKIKKEPIINLISHYSQTFKDVEYTHKNRDIILSLIFWGYVISAIYLLRNVDLNGGFNILLLLAFIILGTFTFMFPIILIVLPLIMSRLLTMGTTKVYGWIASQVSKLFKASGELAERSVRRNPRRVAYLAFILAFILTLSTFIALSMDNVQEVSRINAEAAIGGDLIVDLQGLKVPWDVINDTHYVSSYVISYYAVGSGGVYVMDMGKYMDVIYDGNLFLKEGKLDGSGVVITESYAKSQRIGVGDYTYVVINGTPKQYRIEAIFYTIPGFYYEGNYVTVIDANPSSMKGNVTPYYIILRSNNLEALKEKLREENYRYYEKKDVGGGLDNTQIGLMNTLLLYLVILGAASIVIVQYSSLLNRRGEIALYKVRGARNSQIAALLMTEGITVIILSLIIGLSIGMLLAYFMSSLMVLSINLPMMFIIGWTFIEYTIILLLAYIISQYILSLIFARTNVNEVIRGLGGEI